MTTLQDCATPQLLLLLCGAAVVDACSEKAHLPVTAGTDVLAEEVLAAADVKQRGRLEQGSCRNSSPLCITAAV